MGGLGRGLAQGLGLMTQLRQAHERLELEKKLADVRFKHFELEGEQVRRQLQSGDLLRELLSRTETTPRAGTPLDLEQNPEAAGTMPSLRQRMASPMEIAQTLTPGFPLQAAGLALPAPPAEFTLAPGQVRFQGGQPVAGLPAEPPKPPSVGTDREAIASAMFDKPFADLTPAQRSLVNAGVNEERARLAALQGGVRQALEPSELLSPEEAARLGVPFGKTKQEAFGRQPMTSQQETQKQAREATVAIVTRLSTLLREIKLPKTATERLTQAPRLRLEALRQSNASLILFEALKEGVLANMVRTFGERGTLTDQDIRRARALLPVVVPEIGSLPDTEQIANLKLRQLGDLIKEIDARTGPTPTVPAPTGPPPGFREE